MCSSDLLKETSNARAAAREKAKLAQMEIDGVTPLFPGCRPEDTRLHVTLAALKMKTQNKWTDSSFNKNMKFWHDCLPEGNTLPSSINEAKKVVCPLDLPHEKYHACINDCAIYRGEYKERTTCLSEVRPRTIQEWNQQESSSKSGMVLSSHSPSAAVLCGP